MIRLSGVRKIRDVGMERSDTEVGEEVVLGEEEAVPHIDWWPR